MFPWGEQDASCGEVAVCPVDGHQAAACLTPQKHAAIDAVVGNALFLCELQIVGIDNQWFLGGHAIIIQTMPFEAIPNLGGLSHYSMKQGVLDGDDDDAASE